MMNFKVLLKLHHKDTDNTDRIIETSIKVLNRNFTIVGVYAPVEGKEATEEFYRELKQSIDKIPKKENIILAGDFNGLAISQFQNV
jgi:exonuclease III